MARQNAHTAVAQRVEDRLGEALWSKGCPDVALGKQVNRTSRYKRRKALRADPVCLTLVDERDGGGFRFQRMGDGCRFAIVQRPGGRTGNEVVETLHPAFPEAHDFGPARINPLSERNGVVPACLPVFPKLAFHL